MAGEREKGREEEIEGFLWNGRGEGGWEKGSQESKKLVDNYNTHRVCVCVVCVRVCVVCVRVCDVSFGELEPN